MSEKNLVTKKEAVITISNGNLSFVVWRDRNGRHVFFKCEPMDSEDLMEILPSSVPTFRNEEMKIN